MQPEYNRVGIHMRNTSRKEESVLLRRGRIAGSTAALPGAIPTGQEFLNFSLGFELGRTLEQKFS